MSRARTASSLGRSKGRRARGDYILIVCEGEKTEPLYLREMVRDLQIQSANVKISGDCGSAPQSVVNEAIKLFEEDPYFDKVFCVIDKDGHAKYADAIQKLENHKLQRREGRKVVHTAEFVAIPSIPCFEFWILLHYVFSTAHMARFSDVYSALKQIDGFKHYEKGKKGLYAMTKSRIPTALANASKASEEAAKAGTDNPTTKMPRLVCLLKDMASAKP